MTARKTERIFLVQETPPAPKANAQSRVRMACLSHDRSREVWLRQEGRRWEICVVTEPSSGESDNASPISQATFEALWKIAHVHRVEITRSQVPHGNTSIELDVFHDNLAPLVTARIRFATAAGAQRFRKPAFFGREITTPGSDSLRHIALHGIPSAGDAKVQAGAVPFLFKKGILHIVLITSSSGARWIIPKGHLESGMSLEEVALMEAAEEAGAIGTIEPGCRTQCPTEDGRTLQLFPLRVATLLPHWPERFVRRRVVLPVYRALLRISDPALARALRDLSRRLRP